jgi:hypothetical protein
MHEHRQELLRSATRRIQRGRKTTGRIVASALGFSVAYYFDSQRADSAASACSTRCGASLDKATMRWRQTSPIRLSCLWSCAPTPVPALVR